jgi:aspartyl-tRNA(Asn)/glutamyl-tRNA(Gln) amidotransferase subunit C
MLNEKEIKHLALLARLEIKDSQIKSLLKDIKSIIDYISSLNKVKLDKEKENLTYEIESNSLNFLRNDDGQSLSNDTGQEILNQAPDKKDNYFKVKKII